MATGRASVERDDPVRGAASLLPRAAAFCVDAALLVVLAQAVLLAWFLLRNGVVAEALRSARTLTLFLLMAVTLPAWAYFAATEASPRRATLGKRLMRLSVSDAYGERIGFARALFRNGVKLLPWGLTHMTLAYPTPVYLEAAPDRFRPGFLVVYALLGLYLGAAMLTRRKQSLHDLAAGTYVIRSGVPSHAAAR
jgi:uncharacterized RDD family membrane protein YckC